MALTVRTEPCSSCPYRRDVPSGVWHREEYEKLLQYDDSTEILPAFMCHQPALCWPHLRIAHPNLLRTTHWADRHIDGCLCTPTNADLRCLEYQASTNPDQGGLG